MRQCWPILWICLVYGVTSLAQSNDSAAQIVHVVDAGETLSAIAVNYGVTVAEIAGSNDLDPNALLQIGQRLIIEFNTGADEQTAVSLAELEDVELAATEIPVVPAEPRAIGGVALRNDLPPAPVARSAAPKMDPAAIDPVVCVSLYADNNQNGNRDPGEESVSDGIITLLDEHGNQLAERRAAAETQPLCLGGGQPRIYIVAANPPEGYGLTGSELLRVDLRDGLPLQVAFGVRAGFANQDAPAERVSPTAVAVAGDAADDNLLRELSGLFVLASAGIVLFCGLCVSLLLRFR